MLYWITYTDGTKRVFYAGTRAEAYQYFIMEGDHALEYGSVD